MIGHLGHSVFLRWMCLIQWQPLDSSLYTWPIKRTSYLPAMLTEALIPLHFEFYLFIPERNSFSNEVWFDHSPSKPHKTNIVLRCVCFSTRYEWYHASGWADRIIIAKFSFRWHSNTNEYRGRWGATRTNGRPSSGDEGVTMTSQRRQ